MTRESKIGLIVAGSFLCLVCIVIASKWNGGGAANDPTEAQTEPLVAAIKPKPNTPAADTKKKDPVTKNDGMPQGALPAIPEHQPKPAVEPALVPPPVTGGPMLPAAPSGAAPELPFLPPPVTAKPELPLVPPVTAKPELPLVPPPMTAKPEAPAFPMEPGAFPAFPTFPNKPDEVVAKPAPLELKPAPMPILQAQDDKKKEPLDLGGFAFAPPAPLAPLDEKKVAPAETPKPLPLPTPADPLLPLPIKPEVNPPAPTEKPKVQDPLLPFPPLGGPLPLENVKPAVPTITIPKENPKPAITPIPSDPVVPPGQLPRIGALEMPSTPTISTKPIGITPLPPVTDVNTDLYVCQQVDTSFPILSMRLYGNEKYADAMLAYNRDHSRLVKNAAAFFAAAPKLTPGQQVLHPPASVLERDYRSLVRGSTVPTIPAATPAVNLARPSPLTPTVATIPNAAGGAGTRSYKVQTPTGESILDIAERVLGNRNLWTEIYRINQANPAVRPPAMIPVGTELKLP